MIKLNPDALSIMKATGANGKLLPFDIVFVQADRKRQTGGKVTHFEKAYLSGKKSGSIRNRTINVRPANTPDFVTVHLDLILYLNGEPVA